MDEEHNGPEERSIISWWDILFLVLSFKKKESVVTQGFSCDQNKKDMSEQVEINKKCYYNSYGWIEWFSFS